MSNQIVNVPASDPSIQYVKRVLELKLRTDGVLVFSYVTASNDGTSATWSIEAPASNSCTTPQMLTYRLGDFFTYTFTVRQQLGC